MRLKQDEANDDLVDLSDPHLTRAKSIYANGWCPHNKFKARQGRIPEASRFVDRLKASEFLRPANANEHERFDPIVVVPHATALHADISNSRVDQP